LGEVLAAPVAIGVAAGLVLGKPLGIAIFSWIGVRFGWGRLPASTGWRHIIGLGLLGGIGFTVALFIAGLAFTDPIVTDEAKIGIFAGSLVAGLAGFFLLRGIRLTTANVDSDAAPEATK
jgi:Na+:H+ antiporter, NhaA family